MTNMTRRRYDSSSYSRIDSGSENAHKKNACRMPSEERKELSAVSTAIYGIYDNCGVVEQRLMNKLETDLYVIAVLRLDFTLH